LAGFGDAVHGVAASGVLLSGPGLADALQHLGGNALPLLQPDAEAANRVVGPAAGLGDRRYDRALGAAKQGQYQLLLRALAGLAGAGPPRGRRAGRQDSAGVGNCGR
jgi:hypothetical protein